MAYNSQLGRGVDNLPMPSLSSRPMSIGEHLDRLEELTSVQQASIDELTSRLGPILSPMQGVAGMNSKEVPSITSPVCARLEGLTRKVLSNTDVLRQVNENLTC